MSRLICRLFHRNGIADAFRKDRNCWPIHHSWGWGWRCNQCGREGISYD